MKNTEPTFIVHHSNCLDILKGMADNSIDSICADPPYGLNFMNKGWDKVLPDPAIWKQCLRVLKPGGHMVAFGAPRLYHRLACSIEDQGFEIRDSLMWIFGSGFPKSLNVSKAIDSAGGENPQEVAKLLKQQREAKGLTRLQLAELVGCTESSIRDWEEGRSRTKKSPLEFMVPKPKYRKILNEVLSYTEDSRVVLKEKSTNRLNDNTIYGLGHNGNQTVGGNTENSKKWEGWGTALKPAYEPIILARKPLEGTVASNVLKWGTGGLNIDGCRIGKTKCVPASLSKTTARNSMSGPMMGDSLENSGHNENIGRFPANLILDEESGKLLDEQTGNLTSGKPGIRRKQHETTGMAGPLGLTGKVEVGFGDSGGASRFFYCAKASKKEREAGLESMPSKKVSNRRTKTNNSPRPRDAIGRKNTHPTVKPMSLMQWIVRLITPPGGTVLDPFTGSGSTGCAAMKEGFDFIGCELSAEYVEIANKRIEHARSK